MSSKPPVRNAHAARDALSEIGFTVADGRFKALPTDYCIVGGSGPNDLSADALLALYCDDTPDHRRARGIILGARDRLRVAKPPPREFIDSCRNGLTQDVGVADLRVGADGVRRVVVLVGRQRIQARRIIDGENAALTPPEPPLAVFCVAQTFPRDKDFDVELAALEANCKSNCFVAEPPSALGDKAAMLSAKGMRDCDIAVRIGASGGAEHVRLLIDLAACDPAVWDAIDTNKKGISLADCSTLCKLDPEEQRRRVARKTAGGTKGARDAAAPPRLKTCPSRMVSAIGIAFDKTSTKAPEYTGEDVAALMRWVAGDVTALVSKRFERVWRIVESGEAEMQAVAK